MFLLAPNVEVYASRAMAFGGEQEEEDKTAAAAKPEDLAMSRYASGKDDALAIVYDAIAGRLYGFLLRRCREASLAEDLLQHTFLNMHRARATFVSGSPVLPWAFAIARRLLLDAARKSQRARQVMIVPREDEMPERADLAADVENIADARQASRQLLVKLETLPENQRVAFELLRIDGMSLLEAAETLGITATALKLRAHRAYKALGLTRAEEGS